MNHESLPQENNLQVIERFLGLDPGSMEYEREYMQLRELYKENAFQYPHFINGLKNMVLTGKITDNEHFNLATIYFGLTMERISLEAFRKAIENATQSNTTFVVFNSQELKAIPVPIKEYLIYCVGKLSN